MKENAISVSKRNSSIELLKIIAMVLIVTCHSMPSGNTAAHSWGG